MRNPAWTRDELILALALYKESTSLPYVGSSPMGELAEALGRLHRISGRGAVRNENAIHMKLSNFRALDPAFTHRGLVGLSRGGKGDAEVWDEFGDRHYYEPQRLITAASAIRTAISGSSGPISIEDDEHDVEAIEGGVLTRLHRARERDRGLVRKKKRSVLKRTGRLACEGCEFDFEKTYGDRGRGFAEVHHLRPLHTLPENVSTRLSELAVVCANCHRMIHSTAPWLTLTELRECIRR